MGMKTFEIEIMDSLKKTMDVINSLQGNFDSIEDFCNVEKYADTAYSNNVSITKTELSVGDPELNANPIIQHIEIDRHVDGTQDIYINNYQYVDYNGPVIVETAGDIDVIFNDNEEDDSSNTDEDNDCSCNCDDDEE